MRSLATSLLAFALALAAGALALALLGAPPLEAARGLLASCAARPGDVAAKAAALAFLGTGVAVAFRSGFWNIGAEGQLCMGAAAAAGLGLYVVPTSPSLWSGALLLGGALAGALWCLGPALLRLRWGVSEVVSTLLLVYVARKLLEYLYLGPWKDPKGYGFPGTAELPAALRTPGWAVLGLALAAAAGAALLQRRTRLGFELALLGESWDVARYAGVRPGRALPLAALLSGGLAGLAGAAQVLWTSGRLISGLSVGDGFTAIIVACLAGREPLAVLPTALLWALLKVGADDLELAYGVPKAFSAALEGGSLLAWLLVRHLGRRREDSGAQG